MRESYYIGTKTGRFMINICESNMITNEFNYVIGNDSLHKLIKELVTFMVCPESRQISVLTLECIYGNIIVKPLLIYIDCFDLFPFVEPEETVLKILTFHNFISHLTKDGLIF